MTLVKSLLAIPELRLRLRTGAGRLDRAVSRVYGTELPDPSRYLSPGELVLSGLLWWRGPADAEPFVAALAAADAAALAASGADTGGIPPELVEACERHGIPLLEVPPDLSFAVVTERIILELAADRDTTSEARKRLLAAAAERDPLPALLRHGVAELGAPCAVATGAGRVVAHGGPAPEAPRELAERFLRGGCRATVHGGVTLLPVGERALVPWLLVVGADRAGWPAGRQAVAEELAGLVELARARAGELRRAADRVAEPLLRLVGGGTAGEAELAGALGAAGLPAGARLRVVLARATGSPPGLAAELLTEVLADHPGRAVVGEVGTETWALVDAREWPAGWAAAAASALSTLEPALAADRVLLGIGGPSTVSGLRGASEEARHALGVAARRGDRIAVVSGDQIGAHHLLLAGAPDELRSSLRQRILGPLLAYDEAQHGDLVRTVRVFLECSGSPAAAAKALHVHVNTLRYRIARAGELLGLDLTDFINQVDVYLALCVEADTHQPRRP
ncbi:DNA-binding transcriptional regulator, PucR family [Amycolatopsis arida]|uniref:DNA-binding transcriptional regulator, PucR family n=1 Tax=Amycolatopsis arida TaxID=587909 RepID=A0A1I5KF81_9PSEU|nr:PucR family transcriptional regulator [Amycolatopsis arida]TDX97017.1 DNA-binding PucR family transcriptional regulator [Amycolatopsis arida]SFO83668.1 DNA-binding transcriptional regulator, PucR family [Amycolatopsis arida]